MRFKTAVFLLEILWIACQQATGAPPQAVQTDSVVVLDASKAQPGTYAFLVTVADDGSVSIQQVKSVVRIGDGNIPDDPDTPDDPPTDPPTDNSLSGFVAKTCRETLSYADWKTDAQALAVSYEQFAKAIDDGTIKDTNLLTAAQRIASQQILKAKYDSEWKPWRERLSAKLVELAQSGKLLTLAQHAEAWRDIAKGLREAAK